MVLTHSSNFYFCEVGRIGLGLGQRPKCGAVGVEIERALSLDSGGTEMANNIEAAQLYAKSFVGSDCNGNLFTLPNVIF